MNLSTSNSINMHSDGVFRRRSPRIAAAANMMNMSVDVGNTHPPAASFRQHRPPPLQVQSDQSKDSVQVTHQGAYVVGDFQIDGNGYTLGSSSSSRHSASSRASACSSMECDDVDEELDVNSDNGFRVERLTDLQVCGPICGQGSSGRVRIAEHIPTKRVVALKEVPLDLSEEKSEFVVSELKALHEAQCQNIVSFFGAFYQNSTMFLVMEYMDAGSLSDVARLCENHSIPERILSEIARQVLQGLWHLHSTTRIVHRDIKPSNILLNSQGLVKLADFGVSGRIGRHVHNKDTFVGTVSYMSPERLLGQKHSFDADVWSIGVTLLECALGYYPYRAQQRRTKSKSVFWDGIDRTANGPIPELPAEGFSEEFRSFVCACVRKSPNQRPAAMKLLRHPFISQSNCSKAELRQFLQALHSKQNQERTQTHSFNFHN